MVYRPLKPSGDALISTTGESGVDRKDDLSDTWPEYLRIRHNLRRFATSPLIVYRDGDGTGYIYYVSQLAITVGWFFFPIPIGGAVGIPC